MKKLRKNPQVGIYLGLILMPESNWLVKLDLLPFLIDLIKFSKRGFPLKRAVTCGAAFRLKTCLRIDYG